MVIYVLINAISVSNFKFVCNFFFFREKRSTIACNKHKQIFASF